MDPIEKMILKDAKKNRHAGETEEEKEKRRKNKKRKRQLGMDVSSDTDSVKEEVEKTGYEFTKYMELYNQRTKFDYTKGYDPKKMDDVYKQGLTYELGRTEMPRAVSFTFDWKISGFEITDEALESIKESLAKFNSENDPNVYPGQLKDHFLKHGFNKTRPAMYSMISWITDANQFSGTAGMTFDEFI
jgi:hypothetical protein